VESSGRILNVFNARGVEILNDCNGLDLLGIYTGFIIAYPGPIRERLLLLAGGLLLLYFANVLRIAVLALSNVYYPDYWDNVHRASSYVFFYPLILGLWYIWTIISDQKTIFSAGDLSSA
jgi:exosortase/archaeosortase family protein